MRQSVRKAILDSLRAGMMPDLRAAMVIPIPKPQTIKVNDILNIGMVMCGKVPDVYWNMDLTPTETVILQYVYSNVLRLYTTLKVYPKGKDGSPRFWREKGRMAQDVRVSPVTFRNGVRHLAEMGLVTSMDSSPEDDTAGYCIGLSVEFLDKEFTDGIAKSTSRQKYSRLANYLYNKESVAYARMYTDDPFKPFVQNDYETIDVMLKRIGWYTMHRRPFVFTRKSVKRKAIIVVRVPSIAPPPKPSMVELCRVAREKYNYVLTSEERKVLEVKQYYEYRCRQALNVSGFCVMSTKRKGWRDNKKWKWLVRLYNQCHDNGWDYKVFIDAQFDRLKYFTTKQKYVYLNQFFSEGAIKHYHRYVRDYQERFSEDGTAHIKTKKASTFIQEVARAIVDDCERIQYFIQTAPKRPAFRGMNAEELKIMYFSQHWTSLSKYYLANLPWFLGWLKESVPAGQHVQALIKDITELQKSPAIAQKIHRVVAEAERRLGVPKTMELTAA